MNSIFLEPITQYLYALDWAYILTFIAISYGLNHPAVRSCISRTIGYTLRTRYRVLIIGFCYGVFVFFIRGYTLSGIERLVQSFVFSVVFHKLLVELVVARLFSKKEKSDIPN